MIFDCRILHDTVDRVKETSLSRLAALLAKISYTSSLAVQPRIVVAILNASSRTVASHDAIDAAIIPTNRTLKMGQFFERS